MSAAEAKRPRPPGLMKAVKERLQTEVFSAPSENARMLGSVLVCDDWGLSVLESSFKVNDLTRHGIPIVESIDLVCGVNGGRQSLSRNPVIYFCRCTSANIDRILDDWKPPQKHDPPRDWTTRPYLEAHVFFCSRSTRSLTDKLLPATLLVQHLRSLKEVNLDFLALEPHLFTVDMPRGLPRFFGRDAAQEVAAAADEVAHRIIDVVTTMGDTVRVRHHKGQSRGGVAQAVAQRVVDAQKQRLGTKQGQATLLVVDRSVDPVAPLLHELTYQSMLLDVLPNDPSVVVTQDSSVATRARVKEKDQKETVLDEDDELWCRLRHKHIADNGPVLNSEFQQLVKSSKALSVRKNYASGNSNTAQETADALKELPLMQAKLKRYKLHIDAHEVLMKSIKSHAVDRACDIEQCLATLETTEGLKIDKDALRKEFEAFLETSGPNSYLNKLRILLLYVVSQGGLSKDRQQKWIAALGVPRAGEAIAQVVRGGSDQVDRLIANLGQFDISVEKTKWYQSKPKKEKRNITRAQDAYDWSRYVPCVKRIAENLVANDLPEMDFPHTVPDEVSSVGASSSVAPASSRGSRRTRDGGYASQPGWSASLRQGNAQGGQTTAGGASPHSDVLPWSLDKCKERVYLFIVGGATLSETRSIAEVIHTKETEIIIGSTSVLTPLSFIQNLSEL